MVFHTRHYSNYIFVGVRHDINIFNCSVVVVHGLDYPIKRALFVARSDLWSSWETPARAERVCVFATVEAEGEGRGARVPWRWLELPRSLILTFAGRCFRCGASSWVLCGVSLEDIFL